METYGGVLEDGWWPDSSPPYGGRERNRRGKPPRTELALTIKPRQRANRMVGTWLLSQHTGDETALFNDIRKRLFVYLSQRRIVPHEATKAKRALAAARSLRIRRFLRTGLIFRWRSNTGETFWLAIRETDGLTKHLDELQYQLGCTQDERNKRLAARLQADAA